MGWGWNIFGGGGKTNHDLRGDLKKPKPRLPTALLDSILVSDQDQYHRRAQSLDQISGYEKYTRFAELITNNSIVALGINFYLDLVEKIHWSIAPSDDDVDGKWADRIQQMFDDMESPIEEIAASMSLYKMFGFCINEIIWVKKKEGFEVFNIVPVAHKDIITWNVNEIGSMSSVFLQKGSRGIYGGGGRAPQSPILYREKMLYLVNSRLETTPEGQGILRYALEEHERLQRYLFLQQASFESNLGGYPVAYMPNEEINESIAAGEMNEEEKIAYVEEMGRFANGKIKTGGKGLILDSAVYRNNDDNPSSQKKWGIDILKGEHGDHTGVQTAIDRSYAWTATLLGVQHLILGVVGSSGSYALSETQATQFALRISAVTKRLGRMFQNDVIKRMWEWNGWDENMMPRVVASKLEHEDIDKAALLLKTLSEAGVPIAEHTEAVNNVLERAGFPIMPEDLNAGIEAEDVVDDFFNEEGDLLDEEVEVYDDDDEEEEVVARPVDIKRNEQEDEEVKRQLRRESAQKRKKYAEGGIVKGSRSTKEVQEKLKKEEVD